jgi:hypothetical protein
MSFVVIACVFFLFRVSFPLLTNTLNAVFKDQARASWKASDQESAKSKQVLVIDLTLVRVIPLIISYQRENKNSSFYENLQKKMKSHHLEFQIEINGELDKEPHHNSVKECLSNQQKPLHFQYFCAKHQQKINPLIGM